MARLLLLDAQEEIVPGIVIDGMPEPTYDEKLCWICHQREPSWQRSKEPYSGIKVCTHCKDKWLAWL